MKCVDKTWLHHKLGSWLFGPITSCFSSSLPSSLGYTSSTTVTNTHNTITTGMAYLKNGRSRDVLLEP